MPPRAPIPGSPTGASLEDSPAPGSGSGARFSRRRLVGGGLLGAAVLLVGGALPLALRRGRYQVAVKRPLRVLSPEEHAIVAALAARIVPGEDAPGWPSAATLDCAGGVDAALAALAPRDRRDFKRFVRLLDSALFGVLTVGSAACFTAAGVAEQDRRLRAWQRSRLEVIRSGLRAVERLVLAAYYASPEVFARVGYPGPPAVPPPVPPAPPASPATPGATP